jgi:hypothetical protein
MTSHVARLYALGVALLIFFLTWAAIAARPWVNTTTKADPRVAALAAREQRLRQESIAVRRLVQHRWRVYRVQLRARQAQNTAAHRAQAVAAAAPPPVRVVTLPPLTVTRTS